MLIRDLPSQHEFGSEKQMSTFLESAETGSDETAAFKLLKAFGDTEHNF